MSLLVKKWNLFHGAETLSPYLMRELWHEPMHWYADHLLLPFLTNSSAIITWKFLICKVGIREGFIGVWHNIAPGKKEEKPEQCEISKNHNYCTCGAISLNHLRFHQLCPHLLTWYEFPQNMYEISTEHVWNWRS